MSSATDVVTVILPYRVRKCYKHTALSCRLVHFLQRY